MNISKYINHRDNRRGMRITKMLLVVNILALSTGYAQDSIRNAAPEPEATSADATLSFWDIPVLKEAYIDASPTDRNDGIRVGKLGTGGGNKVMILKLAQEIADTKHGIFDSFLIAHRDTLVFESYFTRGRINLPHPQVSATKAYTGLLLGRAIQLGYLTMADLDKPLVGFLKDLDPAKFVEGVEKITLHQALTMRSGIRISKEQEEEFGKNPAQLKGQGKVQTVFEHSAPITAASQRFLYQGDAMLVMQVIDAVVPGTAEDFIKNEFFDKIGITNYSWLAEVSGLPSAGVESSITSRAMVKLGTLVMNKGKWNGEQLVPEAFITKATSRILYTGDDVDVYGGGKDVVNQGYGYYWWNADLKVGNKSYFSASAQGGGGQYIIVIEELDLIVVATGHNNDGNGVLQTTAERILPAFIK